MKLIYTSTASAFVFFCFYYLPFDSWWWRWDDPYILQIAHQYNPLAYFLSPTVWQEFSSFFLTPWLIFSFDFDCFAFGLIPEYFYFHHLVSLVLVVTASFFLLRLWVNDLWAFLGSFLFLTGAPVLIISQRLMTRHYIEGLLFLILALYFYHRSLREKCWLLSLGGSMFYLLSITCKEIYVPLVAILPLWPARNFRTRAVYSLNFVLIALLYMAWRYHMLGSLIGNVYGFIPAHIRLNYSALLPSIFSYCFGKTPFSIFCISIVGSLLLLGLWQNRSKSLLFLAVLAAVVGPLLPISGMIVPGRHVFLFWWVIVILLTSMLSNWKTKFRAVKFSKIIVYLLILFVVVSHSKSVIPQIAPKHKRYDTIGRFLWRSTENPLMLYVTDLASSSQYMSGLLYLKQKTGQVNQDTYILADRIQLDRLDLHRNKIWAYDPQLNKMIEVSKKMNDELEKWGETRIGDKPLHLKMGYNRQNEISWRFGPYKEGRYTIITVNEQNVTGKFDLPAQGKVKVFLKEFDLYLKYQAPEEWITYSPKLTYDPQSYKTFKWER